jgi:hypothetical protein
MIGRFWRAVLLSVVTCGSALAQPKGDLRNIELGTQIKSLSTDGYIKFACAGQGGASLKTWFEFGACAKDAQGFHAVHFQYGDDPLLAPISEDGQGTKAAGQPVVLTLYIDDTGILHGLRMQTDPDVRLFIKRRAHIFGLQAMARYGDDNWKCARTEPTPHEQPLGQSFANERCEKSTADRHYVVDRALYHDPDLPITKFVSQADLEIWLH